MGTGNRVAAEVNGGQYSKIFSLSHTDPYTTVDGVSRTVSATYRKLDQYTQASSDFETETGTLGLDYAWPITEFQSVRMGLVAQRADLFTDPNSSAREASDWVLGTTAIPIEIAEVGNPPISSHSSAPSSTPSSSLAGWSFDSRNRALFADRGARHPAWRQLHPARAATSRVLLRQLRLPAVHPDQPPFHDHVEYGARIRRRARRHDALPPFRNHFAGGPETVRGYQESELGPKDSFGNPYGGNLKVINQLELLLPIPESGAMLPRFSILRRRRQRVFDRRRGFRRHRRGHTRGIQVRVLINRALHGCRRSVARPAGVFRFSYAYPLNLTSRAGTSLSCVAGGECDYGDETGRLPVLHRTGFPEVFPAMRSKSAFYALLALALATMVPVADAAATGAAQDRLRQCQPFARRSATGRRLRLGGARGTSSRAGGAIWRTSREELKTREEKLQKDGAVMAENERRNAEKDAARRPARARAQAGQSSSEDLNVRRNEALGQLQRAVVQEIRSLCGEPLVST